MYETKNFKGGGRENGQITYIELTFSHIVSQILIGFIGAYISCLNVIRHWYGATPVRSSTK